MSPFVGQPGFHDRGFVVFYTPSMEAMAKALVDRYSGGMRLGEISWKTFEDGFPNIMIESIADVRGNNVVFLASWLDHNDLLPQLSVIYQLPRYMCKSLFIVMPYFPTGTMERVDTEGQIATAATFARLITATPPTISGPPRVVMYDIHALQERFYFGDGVLPLLGSAVGIFHKRLQKFHQHENVVIAFPDDGACKRFGKKFPEYNLVICNKVRVGADGRQVVIKDGAEFVTEDAHVFIVDDLVKTGGTLIECKDALLKAGAKQVSAFVTHAVFPLESWKRFSEPKEGETPFHSFLCTDSCPEVTSIIQSKKPFQILSLAKHIGEMVLKF